MKTIKFEKGIAELDLATLSRTASYEMAKGGLPKNRGMEHHELITEICDRADSINNVSIEVDPIYCTEKQTMRVMWGGNKDDCPVENNLLQRLTTRIQIRHKDDDVQNMAVGLSYNEKGLTMAMGPNIWVCANQNVFGDNLMSTYTMGGKAKMNFGDIMQVLGAWLTNFERKREDDYGKITLMQDTVVERGSIQLLYGELIEEAVLANMDSEVHSPMNITQVTNFVRQAHSEEYKVPAENDVKVWDLAQMGTAVLRPNANDYTSAYQTLNNFNDFLLRKYELN